MTEPIDPLSDTKINTPPPFKFNLAAIPLRYSGDFAETITDPVLKQRYLDAFGADFAYRRILQVPSLRASYSEVPPGKKVPPHRHGANQFTFVLEGSLRYGARTANAGMGQFNPQRFYAWTAGDKGAKFVEVHDSGVQMTIFPSDAIPERRDAEDPSVPTNPFIFDLRADALVNEHSSIRQIVCTRTFSALHCILAPDETLSETVPSRENSFCFILKGNLRFRDDIAGPGMGYYWPGVADAISGAEGADFLMFSSVVRQE